jgi:hypothetical protein
VARKAQTVNTVSATLWVCCKIKGWAIRVAPAQPSPVRLGNHKTNLIQIRKLIKLSRGLFTRNLVMAKEYEVRKVGRDSRDGQFIPIKEAERRPDTTEVERVRYPKK